MLLPIAVLALTSIVVGIRLDLTIPLYKTWLVICFKLGKLSFVIRGVSD